MVVVRAAGGCRSYTHGTKINAVGNYLRKTQDPGAPLLFPPYTNHEILLPPTLLSLLSLPVILYYFTHAIRAFVRAQNGDNIVGRVYITTREPAAFVTSNLSKYIPGTYTGKGGPKTRGKLLTFSMRDRLYLSRRRRRRRRRRYRIRVIDERAAAAAYRTRVYRWGEKPHRELVVRRYRTK